MNWSEVDCVEVGLIDLYIYSPTLKKGGYKGFGLSVIPFVRLFVRLSVIIVWFPLNIFRTLL